MRFILMLMLMMCIGGVYTSSLSAESIHRLSYVTYKGRADADPLKAKIINTFDITIGSLADGEREVDYFEQRDDRSKHEVYTVDSQWQTLSWEVKDGIGDKHYKGKRVADRIELYSLEQETLIDTIDIDSKPFYFNPKIGLRQFVLSGKEQITFWGIRHDNFKVYPMLAENRGLEWIDVNGKKIEAYKIYWAAQAGFAKYFHRVYWFRKSDAMYVKQKSTGKKYKVLIAEEESLMHE